MYSATALQEVVYKEFPDLHQQEPDWRVLYEEKKRAYTELFEEQGVELMPGVEGLLEQLAEKGKKRCVVTHSAKTQVDAIREMLPPLKSIPCWLTREDYSEPKPSSECYLKAIELYGKEGDQVIGFEDSPRGLKALIGSGAKSVLLSELISREEAASFTSKGVTVSSSFSSLTKKWDG
ncbi:MAG: Phosphoglycolate phosphatase [Chlamydiae bacterium]|nr:Phosphoglycolate phosphatase [Chlamydiota bacterium]